MLSPLPPMCSVETACYYTPSRPAQGLSSKTAKEGALPPVPLLLLPATHLQWHAVKTTSGSLWKSARSKGTLVIVALATSCGALALWVFSDEVVALGDMVVTRFPSVLALRSVPGLSTVGPVGSIVLRWAGGTASAAVRVMNPFEGARDALRLQPFKVSYLFAFWCSVVAGVEELRNFVFSPRKPVGAAVLPFSVSVAKPVGTIAVKVLPCAAPTSCASGSRLVFAFLLGCLGRA